MSCQAVLVRELSVTQTTRVQGPIVLVTLAMSEVMIFPVEDLLAIFAREGDLFLNLVMTKEVLVQVVLLNERHIADVTRVFSLP